MQLLDVDSQVDEGHVLPQAPSVSSVAEIIQVYEQQLEVRVLSWTSRRQLKELLPEKTWRTFSSPNSMRAIGAEHLWMGVLNQKHLFRVGHRNSWLIFVRGLQWLTVIKVKYLLSLVVSVEGSKPIIITVIIYIVSMSSAEA